MHLVVFSTKPYDREFFTRANNNPAVTPTPHTITFHSFPLTQSTASLAHEADAVCAFVNDALPGSVLRALRGLPQEVRAILLRCAGYNNVDLATAKNLSLSVANVPAYSPEAVAEFAVALVQTLNRKTHRAYNRVREGNFELSGLMGQTLYGKTVGVVGTGRIGLAFARVMARGFGCKVVATDPFPAEERLKEAVGPDGGNYVELDELLRVSDVVSLHCPLTDDTKHIINGETLAKLKKGAVLVNTSRGGLVNTQSVIAALKSKHLGGLALDVYEGEGELFYQDHSAEIIQDDDLMRLMTFPNVLVSGHQGFFTEEALTEIAECTLRNFDELLNDKPCKNALVRQGQLARRDSLPVRI
ncbi:uncharacterized protein C8A04DRAFT_11121 [Dichotomopilus funicola]|uniref:D-lactate dehydrogenase n=1 Tax=Dichotomopilus funicola TaxID=1934379 RepID=A0AAN6ZPS9_9PEZI|nr:hypothetical protein C8A04DRAFT_11121 [Dichotomopilus funicola]